MVRHWNIVKNYYGKISENYSIEDLRNLRKRVSEEIFRESLRGLWEIFDKEVLHEIMCCLEKSRAEKCESVQQENASVVFEGALRRVRNWGKFTNSPQGRRLEEQYPGEFNDFMRIVPHEIALASLAIQEEYKAFQSKHRNESIKAYGNAVVSQVVYQIFKTINEYERKRLEHK